MNVNIGSFFVTLSRITRVFVGYTVKVGGLRVINEVLDAGGGY